MKYEAVIGLEVHVQLNTKTKIFCSCSTDVHAPANAHVCPICLGEPGILPVFNKEALHKAIQVGIALEADVNLFSRFDRKNYFYPDLAKGYQITQLFYPIVENGTIHAVLEDGTKKDIGVTRAHLEEDAGKLIHSEHAPISEVDFNRAGTPLLEIVSNPEMHSAEEAIAYLKELRLIMKHLGVSDVNMEEGSMRCDANVSVRPYGQKEFGTKVEVKNMNSFSKIQKAIEYEITRQSEMCDKGEVIHEETRLFDVNTNKSVAMRSKETANDYRYFPEPDLPAVHVTKEEIDEVRKNLPELPAVKQNRYLSTYKLSLEETEYLLENIEVADYFEKALSFYKGDAKKILTWILVEYMAAMNNKGFTWNELENKIKPESLSELLTKIDTSVVNAKIAREVFFGMLETGETPSVVIKNKGLEQVSDTSLITKVVEEIMEEFPDEVTRYKAGEKRLQGFFMGQMMKKMKGKADPKVLIPIFNEKMKN